MICAVIAPGLPRSGQWAAWIARTTGASPPWLSVIAPPHLPLGTQNDVPMAMYIQLSRSREGSGSYDNYGRSRRGFYHADAPHRACPAKICPSIIHFIFGGKVAVCQEISFKIFSRRRSPALMEREIRLLCVPSAFAISALLIPRKKCA